MKNPLVLFLMLIILGVHCRKDPPQKPANEQAAGVYHGTLRYTFTNPFQETVTPADLTVEALESDSVVVIGMDPLQPGYTLRIAQQTVTDSLYRWSFGHAYGGFVLDYFPDKDSVHCNITTIYSLAASYTDFYGRR